MILKITTVAGWLAFCGLAAYWLPTHIYDWRLAVAILIASGIFFAVRRLHPVAYLLTILGGLVVVAPIVSVLQNEPVKVAFMIFITGFAGICNLIIDDVLGVPRRFLPDSSP